MSVTVEQPKSYFELGEQLYSEKKSDQDVDLVPIVREALAKEGVSEEALKVCFDGNRFVIAAQGRVSPVQRTHLNQFLVLAMLASPLNTIQIRSELLPNGSMDDWVDHIQNTVAPFIGANKVLV